MLVTFFGIVTDCKLLQPQKVPAPMLSTLSGIVTDCKLLQAKKAPVPISVTPSFITTICMFSLLAYHGVHPKL